MLGAQAHEVFADPAVAALAIASCRGDTAGVRAIARSGASLDQLSDSSEDILRGRATPLLWALSCQNTRGVEALLAAGADPNLPNTFGSTPMTEAAGMRDSRFLRILLQYGGNPNADDGRTSALQIALEAANGFELVDGLPPDQTWANWNMLLAAGADPGVTVTQGLGTMMIAAQSNQWGKVEWLLDQGWDGDRVLLGWMIENAERVGFIPEERLPALERVKECLAAAGVRFPVGALSGLERDGRGFYVQR